MNQNRTLRVTLVQETLHWEDIVSNRTRLEGILLDLQDSTDLVVLPEMFSTGFTMNAAANAEPMDGPTIQWMRRMAIALQAVITGSLIIESDGKHYNRLIWMQPDGEYRHYDKRHLFTLAGEEKTYQPGHHRLIFECKGFRVFPLICYDLRFPVWSRRTADFDYDLLLYVANWPERRSAAWRRLLPARAIENQCYVVGVNRVGEDGHGIMHVGDSVGLDFKGDSLTDIPPYESNCTTLTLELAPLHDFRKQFPFGDDADGFEFKS